METKEKIKRLLAWLEEVSRFKDRNMLYLVMYDIENDRIRTHIAKYLIRRGCMRIQKSVYLAKSNRKVYNQINNTLKEINEMYENHDSIFLLPVPEEKFNHIKVIGQHVEFELVTRPKNMLFF